MPIPEIYNELIKSPGMFNEALTEKFLEAAFSLMYEHAFSECRFSEKEEQDMKSKLVTPPLYPGCLLMLLTGQFVKSSSSFVDRLTELNGPEIRFSQLCEFLGIRIKPDPFLDHELLCAASVFNHVRSIYGFS